MINHHPSIDLLTGFVLGELPASLSAAIAMHNEFCPNCQKKVALMTEQFAETMFESGALPTTDAEIPAIDHKDKDSAVDEIFAGMIDSITSSDDLALAYEDVPVTIEVKGHKYELPRAIRHMNMSKWSSLGKLSRSRISLDEGEIHTSLLQIEAGGSVPKHTHKGFELTLLLSGEFHDEKGVYVPGDFIMLDASDQHTPITDTGCLCYTVANAPQHFTQGLNKLLNPIGSLVY